MEKNIKTPIEVLACALGEMTARAMEAERQIEAAKEDAKNWYELFHQKDVQLKEAEAKLAAEIEAHHRTRRQFKEVIERHKKGAE